MILCEYVDVDKIISENIIPKEDYNKIAMMDYWGSMEGYRNVIKPYQHWTPLPYPKNAFVGYFFEHVCPSEIIPPANRSDYGLIWGKLTK